MVGLCTPNFSCMFRSGRVFRGQKRFGLIGGAKITLFKHTRKPSHQDNYLYLVYIHTKVRTAVAAHVSYERGQMFLGIARRGSKLLPLLHSRRVDCNQYGSERGATTWAKNYQCCSAPADSARKTIVSTIRRNCKR